MPIPADIKEKLRHEVRRLLNRKGYKSRLHLVQKNEHVHEVGVPILGILEKVSALSSRLVVRCADAGMLRQRVRSARGHPGGCCIFKICGTHVKSWPESGAETSVGWRGLFS